MKLNISLILCVFIYFVYNLVYETAVYNGVEKLWDAIHYVGSYHAFAGLCFYSRNTYSKKIINVFGTLSVVILINKIALLNTSYNIWYYDVPTGILGLVEGIICLTALIYILYGAMDRRK